MGSIIIYILCIIIQFFLTQTINTIAKNILNRNLA